MDQKAVSSLYGPGVVGGWLLGLLSVLISLNLNPRVRRNGTLKSELVATLSFPVIASSHACYAMRHSDAESCEAAMAVCQTFVLLTPLLIGSTGYWGNNTMLTWILAASAPCYMFQCAVVTSLGTYHPEVLVAMRPPMFSWLWIFALAIWVVILLKSGYFGSWSIFVSHPFCGINAFFAAGMASLDVQIIAMRVRSSISVDPRVGLYFVPTTPYSIDELEQALALGLGVAVLLLSVFDAVKETRLHSTVESLLRSINSKAEESRLREFPLEPKQNMPVGN
ncbi:hypothetical protein BDV96DRAFT_691046 [Lophiotrema nucula]|uniref:Uncharacterized protein n=1 Tax=Lophiotrema nucula TaxID=690887 RepID=A0A6A5YW30_9PLEO|nr:hypothetical protein BDV96DRAFT_691046 [Lophiotrema nucula]